MNLSEFAISELVALVCGEVDLPTRYLKGQELTNLFNRYGYRDVYDFNAGGLPFLKKTDERRPSRKSYVKDRINGLNGKNELRELLETVLNMADNKAETVREFDKILSPEGFTIESDGDNLRIIGGHIVNEPPIENHVVFDKIQDDILSNLDKAQVSIIVAVAWFTNQTLANKLIDKFNQGIPVEVIIYKDGVNTNHGVNLAEIPVYKIRGENGGIMYSEFCVIDNRYVGEGSYNWTTNAETRNTENYQFTLNSELATKYSVQFRNLKKFLK